MNLKLKVAILKVGLPQYKIARFANMRSDRLSAIIHEWESPKWIEKFRLAEILNCRVEDIFEDSKAHSFNEENKPKGLPAKNG